MARELTLDEVDRVTAALYAGRKLEAIKFYRTASGDDLTSAKQIVDGIEARLRAESPEKFAVVAQPALATNLLVFVVVAIVGGVTLFLLTGRPNAVKKPPNRAQGRAPAEPKAPQERRPPDHE